MTMFRLKVLVLIITLLGGCADLPGQAEHKQTKTQKRPNIIFLLADDQSAGTLSSAGHPVLQTPNLDRLVNEGTVFQNAFTVQPICAPSRFAILTGQYERTNGLGFSSPYRATEQQWQQTYPALLRKNGYHTGFIGKFGVEFYTFRGQTQNKFDFWRAHDGWLSFFVKDNPGNTDIRHYADSKQEIATEIMGESIEIFLDSLPEDKPFQLSVSFSAPHGSMTSTMYLDADTSHCTTRQCKKMGVPANRNPRLANHLIYSENYRDAGITPPEDLFRDPNYYLPTEVVDHDKRKQWYDYLYDPETNPEHTVRYYQQITGIDRVVGQLWQQLKEKDLLDNTIIIYSSDHGLITGDYGVGGKGLLYDKAAKVPLIIVDPREAKGIQSDALVLTVDLAPTMLSMAGVSVPDIMQGRNLQKLLVEPNANWRDEVLIENLTTVEDKTMSEALRTSKWKYIRYFATPECPYKESDLVFSDRSTVFEQLFNLKNDPDERNNLVKNEKYTDTLQDMRERISNRSRELSDESIRYKSKIELASRETGKGCW